MSLDDNKSLCQPEQMQKIALLGKDNTDVIFEKKEEDEINSRSNLAKNLYQTHYFEVHLSQGEHMAIQLESEHIKFIYHNATSSFLNIIEHNATTTKQLKVGDTLMFVCSFWNKDAFEKQVNYDSIFD